MTDTLSMWTVYDHPKDYPHCYVARRFEIGDGIAAATHDVIVSVDLPALREVLALKGLTPLARTQLDEPHIIETWL